MRRSQLQPLVNATAAGGSRMLRERGGSDGQEMSARRKGSRRALLNSRDENQEYIR